MIPILTFCDKSCAYINMSNVEVHYKWMLQSEVLHVRYAHCTMLADGLWPLGFPILVKS